MPLTLSCTDAAWVPPPSRAGCPFPAVDLAPLPSTIDIPVRGDCTWSCGGSDGTESARAGWASTLPVEGAEDRVLAAPVASRATPEEVATETSTAVPRGAGAGVVTTRPVELPPRVLPPTASPAPSPPATLVRSPVATARPSRTAAGRAGPAVGRLPGSTPSRPVSTRPLLRMEAVSAPSAAGVAAGALRGAGRTSSALEAWRGTKRPDAGGAADPAFRPAGWPCADTPCSGASASSLSPADGIRGDAGECSGSARVGASAATAFALGIASSVRRTRSFPARDRPCT